MSTTRDQALKERILSEIRRLSAPSGTPPSQKRFSEITGFSSYQIAKFWPRYSDAIKEAGLIPNAFGKDQIPRDKLLQFLAVLTRDLGQFPTSHHMHVAKTKSHEFPAPITFQKWLGSRSEMIQALLQWTNERDEFLDVAGILVATGIVLRLEYRKGRVQRWRLESWGTNGNAALVPEPWIETNVVFNREDGRGLIPLEVIPKSK